MLLRVIFFHFIEQVPSVLLVLEGGTAAIETVYLACQEHIPVVLIKGSGRAVKVLEYALQLDETFTKDNKNKHEGLLSEIEKIFNVKRGRADVLHEKIRCCMLQKENVSRVTISFRKFQ